MANRRDAGVFKLENGCWAYRFTVKVDGETITRRKTVDDNGLKFRTKTDAIKAREAALQDAIAQRVKKKPTYRHTIKEVFEEFCESGRTDRAYRTIQKQDSLWRNHLCERFGKRFCDDVSPAEVIDYLSELYFVEGFSYQYTQSFLKMFYLIFGQAYSRNYLDVDAYNKLCVNKDTKIRMPKMKTEDDTDIVSFSHKELTLLDEYFKGTNAETAYLLGRHCGLRINETFGLKWCNVDLENGTITIDRQMQYQEGIIKLVAPKTRNSRRTIYMSDVLCDHLTARAKMLEAEAQKLAAIREQKQRFIDDLDGKKISSLELVTCLPNGTIQTVNSMKYPTREIKSKLGIEFKYHYLRHTFGTLLAEMNTPVHLLCNQMGHGNIHVSQRYYLAISKSGIDVLRENLNKL